MSLNSNTLFFKTFPRDILPSIINMVSNDIISRDTGKRLLYVYIDTHKELLNSIVYDQEFNYKERFEYHLNIQFPE